MYSLFIAITLSCQIPEPKMSAASLTPSKTFPVTRIVDGDTFWVNNGTQKGLKIRIIGIDAPKAKRTRELLSPQKSDRFPFCSHDVFADQEQFVQFLENEVEKHQAGGR